MIYFAQAGIGGPIKIGHTSGQSVRGRLASLQSCCPWPLLVVALMPGSCREERALHERFSELRLRGEWFRASEPLTSWLRDRGKSYPHQSGCSVVQLAIWRREDRGRIVVAQ